MLLSHTPELRMNPNRDAKDGLSHAERRQNGRRFAAFCNAARNALILNGLRTDRIKAVVMHREGRHHASRRPSSRIEKAIILCQEDRRHAPGRTLSCVMKAVNAVRLDGLSVQEWRTALIGSADSDPRRTLLRIANRAATRSCKPCRDKELQVVPQQRSKKTRLSLNCKDDYSCRTHVKKTKPQVASRRPRA